MVTLAQRIEALRTQAGLSRAALSAALGFPKGAFDKFETGRQTPSKEQQEKIAAYFGVSLFYLKGESNDQTRQDNWMNAANQADDDAPEHSPLPAPKRPKAESTPQGGTLLASVLGSKEAQALLQSMVLNALRSPDGLELITKIVHKELAKRN